MAGAGPGLAVAGVGVAGCGEAGVGASATGAGGMETGVEIRLASVTGSAAVLTVGTLGRASADGEIVVAEIIP